MFLAQEQPQGYTSATFPINLLGVQSSALAIFLLIKTGFFLGSMCPKIA